MYTFNVILLCIGIFQCINNTAAVLLTNEFAVHIPGGDLVADETARKYGFLNKGQVTIFLFRILVLKSNKHYLLSFSL